VLQIDSANGVLHITIRPRERAESNLVRTDAIGPLKRASPEVQSDGIDIIRHTAASLIEVTFNRQVSPVNIKVALLITDEDIIILQRRAHEIELKRRGILVNILPEAGVVFGINVYDETVCSLEYGNGNQIGIIEKTCCAGG
jgi:hypothetical protein